jgi:hypothetical protein
MKKLTFKQEMRVHDIIFYTCIIVLFAWIILKLVGVIQTPIWLELLPLIMVGFSMVTAASKIGRYFGRMEGDMHFLKKHAYLTTTRLEKLDDLHHDFHAHLEKYHN